MREGLKRKKFRKRKERKGDMKFETVSEERKGTERHGRKCKDCRETDRKRTK